MNNFKFEIDYNDYIKGQYGEKIIVETSAESDINEVCNAFRSFLRAAGYAESSINSAIGEQ